MTPSVCGVIHKWDQPIIKWNLAIIEHLTGLTIKILLPAPTPLTLFL